ncbi:PAAR-like domain-containing protein [Rhizobium ruizarguesonis]
MSIPRDNYVGEPDYPATWTTRQPREGLRDLDEAKIVSLSPDVCLTPVGSSVVPIPYPIVDYCGHDMGYTPSVLFTGKKAMVMRSRTTHVHGDAPGTRKGVKSGTVEDVCEPIGHADQVRAESSHVIRHLDRFWMNNRNTQGEAIFVRGTQTYVPPKDDDPVRGSLRSTGSDEGRVISDASPEVPIMGAQYAQANVGTMTGVGGGVPVGGTTRGATTTAPSTTQTPTAGSQIGSQVLKRLGIWGRAASLVLDDLSKSQAEKAAEARAFQAILSGPGDYVMTQNRLLGGRQHVSNPLDMFNSSAWEGKYGLIINDSERVPLANDILSTLAGKPMDVRTMSDAEVQGVLSPFQGLSDDQIEQKLKEMTEARKKEEEEQKPKPVPPPPLDPGSNTRIDDKKKKECLIGPYDEIFAPCTARGGKTHHVVPDMVYRLGDRAGKVTTERVPNAPTEGQGESICLTSDEHSNKNDSGGVHEHTRKEFAGIDHPEFPGTAPMGRILQRSQAALMQTKDIDKVCAEAANARAEAQVRAKTGLRAPGRIKEKPLPSGRIADVLRNGRYP